MKIKKGYTLSRFVDYLQNDPKNISHNEEYDEIYFLDLIFAYNKLYKQPLHKGLFIPCDENGYEIEEPVYFDNIDAAKYITDLNAWKEAEKKVIFKNVENISNEYYDSFIFDNYQLIFFSNGIIRLNKINEIHLPEIITLPKSIGDLFEATTGELDINIEI
jgi:hypothetical protein